MTLVLVLSSAGTQAGTYCNHLEHWVVHVPEGYNSSRSFCRATDRNKPLGGTLRALVCSRLARPWSYLGLILALMGRLSSPTVIAWPPTVTFLLPLPTLDACCDSPTTLVSHVGLGLVAHDETKDSRLKKRNASFPDAKRRMIGLIGDFCQVGQQVLTQPWRRPSEVGKMLARAELVDLGCGLACISSSAHQSCTKTGDMKKTCTRGR